MGLFCSLYIVDYRARVIQKKTEHNRFCSMKTVVQVQCISVHSSADGKDLKRLCPMRTMTDYLSANSVYACVCV